MVPRWRPTKSSFVAVDGGTSEFGVKTKIYGKKASFSLLTCLNLSCFHNLLNSA